MSGWMNRGKYEALDRLFEGGTLEGSAYMLILYTSDGAAAIDPDWNVIGDITEIAAGNGYTQYGQEITPATEFDALTEDDTNDRATVQITDQTWSASGGTIPASGSDIYYVGMSDKHATPASRELLYVWSLGADYSVSSGQDFTVQDAEIRLSES